jgi:antitoxin component of RelBE/YafQ-DinJ toxin-antitoxin module
MGLSVSDAIRLLMLRIADEQKMPFEVQITKKAKIADDNPVNLYQIAMDVEADEALSREMQDWQVTVADGLHD